MRLRTPCEELDLWLERHRDGELCGRAARAADEHLEECPSCRERLAHLDRLGEMLRSALRGAVRPGGIEAVAERLAPRADPRAVAFRPWVPRWGAVVAAGAAVALAVSATLYFALPRMRGEPERMAGTGAPAEPGAEPMHVEIVHSDRRAPPVRLVATGDPQWQVVWIDADEEPSP